jgi:hypothetical protein
MDAKQLTFYVSFGWFKEAHMDKTHMDKTHMDKTHMDKIGHRFLSIFPLVESLVSKHKGFQQQKLEGRKSLVILFQ